jgi:DNA-binding response OmpR family regulator
VSTPATILLADDSPHAQRMGERILREEGYEVITVTDGETAILRVKDANPDIVIVDAFLPQVSGYDLCGFIKKQPKHAHVRVLLTSTALERVDEDQAFRSGADGQLKKPFEASVMLKSLKDLISGSDKDSKKKRSGSTFDLSGPTAEEESAAKQSPGADAREESRTSEKGGVSALQAWLDQHSDDDEAKRAHEDPLGLHDGTDSKGDEKQQDDEPLSVSNPQLLRRKEDEEEDISLRNNPVARRLKNAPVSGSLDAVTDDRVTEFADRKADGAGDGPSVRTIRMTPKPTDEDEEETSEGGSSDAPKQRRSLLDVLAQYESDSEVDDEEGDPIGIRIREDELAEADDEAAAVAEYASTEHAGDVHDTESAAERMSESSVAVEVAEQEAPVAQAEEAVVEAAIEPLTESEEIRAAGPRDGPAG